MQKLREHKYKLVNRIAVPVKDLLEWAEYFEQCDRRIFITEVSDGTLVTVFFGLDSNFGMGEPILFGTGFIPKIGTITELEDYATWEEAEKGHSKHLENKTWTKET